MTPPRRLRMPQSALDDPPAEARLAIRAQALEAEVRHLTSTHRNWLDEAARVMVSLDTTADRLAGIAAELKLAHPPSEP